MARPRMPEAANLLKDNIALLAVRNTRRDMSNNYFVTSTLVDKDGISSFDNCRFFPLFVYKTSLGVEECIPNLNKEIVTRIEQILGEKISPTNLFDYIYAALYCPKYREVYKEFLKIDFPRIPYPTDKDQFQQLVALGEELRKLHLMEGAKNWERRITFPVTDENIVEAIRYDQGKVWINDTQYFGGVSELTWTFFIGGYQPAQKWLKDRRGRKLDYKDILHYGHIIYALEETDRIMKEIDPVLFP